MEGQPKALVACCECTNREVLVTLIAQAGLKPMIATNTSDAVSLLQSGTVAVAFCHDDPPGDGSKIVLNMARRYSVPVVVSSRLDDPKHYLEAMEAGAFDFICTPYLDTEVAALTRAMLRRFPHRTED